MALIPVLFAYSGWNAATYVTGRDARPRARASGARSRSGRASCVALYMAVNAVYLRAMPLARARRRRRTPPAPRPLALGGERRRAVLSPLVAVCVLSSLQATVLVGPRIYQAMADDGLFFAAARAPQPEDAARPSLALVRAGGSRCGAARQRHASTSC